MAFPKSWAKAIQSILQFLRSNAVNLDIHILILLTQQ